MSSGFPFSTDGVTFRARAELENAIEQLAKGPTVAHTKAAANLIRAAISARVLNADQAQEIKTRLHL
jgi:hypothetical protein